MYYVLFAVDVDCVLSSRKTMQRSFDSIPTSKTSELSFCGNLYIVLWQPRVCWTSVCFSSEI